MTLAEINAELRVKFANALYLVNDQSNVDAIEATKRAACVPQCAAYVGQLLPQGCTAVVLIDVQGEGEIRRIVQREAPHVCIYGLTVPGGMNVATFLGFDPTHSTTWAPAQAEAARETLLDLACTKAMRLSDATADAPAAFPVDVLPSMLRALVTEGAAAMNVDHAFFGAPMLGVLAGAIGASRRVIVRPDWQEPSILWVATIGPSGCGKSAPLDVLLRPVREHDAELQHQNALALEQHRAALAAAKRAEGGEAPEAPRMRHALVDDITIEALAVRLADNPKGLLLGCDELAGWFNGFDQYRGGRGGDEARWLSAFGGRPIKVDRKAGGTLFIERPAVSVVGTSQPRVIARLLGRQQRESGLAARLLVACPPTRAALWSDESISDQTLRDWHLVASSLLDLSMNDEPIRLPLSPEATGLFRRWHDRSAEDGQRAGTAGNEDVAAANAKMRSIVPRIALVLALAKAAEEGTAELLRVVDEEAMHSALVLGDYFTGQARDLYASIHTEGASLAGRVLARIREGSAEGATRTDIRDALQRNAPAEDVDEAIGTLLANKMIVRMPSGPGPGRPAERWRVA